MPYDVNLYNHQNTSAVEIRSLLFFLKHQLVTAASLKTRACLELCLFVMTFPITLFLPPFL